MDSWANFRSSHHSVQWRLNTHRAPFRPLIAVNPPLLLPLTEWLAFLEGEPGENGAVSLSPIPKHLSESKSPRLGRFKESRNLVGLPWHRPP